ncbi:MAG: hypothetical protein M9957_01865 [Rhodobacteraceae bacterium]|nr:hypothetical protein [Paracoccaceae bacterium]
MPTAVKARGVRDVAAAGHLVAGSVHLQVDIGCQTAKHGHADRHGEDQRDAVFDKGHTLFILAETGEKFGQSVTHLFLPQLRSEKAGSPAGDPNRKQFSRLPIIIAGRGQGRIVWTDENYTQGLYCCGRDKPLVAIARRKGRLRPKVPVFSRILA